VRTDRQQSLKLLDSRQRALQLKNTISDISLQLGYSESDLDSSVELEPIERLGHVVIRSGAKPLDHVLFIGFCGQHDQIRWNYGVQSLSPAAQFGSIDPGHHPIEDCHSWYLTLKLLPRFVAVARGLYFVAPLNERHFEKTPRNWIVFCNQ